MNIYVVAGDNYWSKGNHFFSHYALQGLHMSEIINFN